MFCICLSVQTRWHRQSAFHGFHLADATALLYPWVPCVHTVCTLESLRKTKEKLKQLKEAGKNQCLEVHISTANLGMGSPERSGPHDRSGSSGRSRRSRFRPLFCPGPPTEAPEEQPRPCIEALRASHDRPQRPQERPRTAHAQAPRAAQECQNRFKSGPRSPMEAPKAAQNRRKEGPKSGSGPPTEAPRATQDSLRTPVNFTIDHQSNIQKANQRDKKLTAPHHDHIDCSDVPLSYIGQPSRLKLTGRMFCLCLLSSTFSIGGRMWSSPASVGGLRPVCAPLRAALNRSWRLCGRSWGCFAASVSGLGRSWDLCWRSWATFGASVNGFGRLWGYRRWPQAALRSLSWRSCVEMWPKPRTPRASQTARMFRMPVKTGSLWGAGTVLSIEGNMRGLPFESLWGLCKAFICASL